MTSVTTPQENLIDWLRDAHAMEMQAQSMLEAQYKRLEHYSELRLRIDQHWQETRDQILLVHKCLERLGDQPSTLKDLGGKFMAFAQSVGGMTMSDEVIKGAMASYVFENVEIAMYTVLIETARQADDSQTRVVCEKILAQEIAMADWLKKHLPKLVQEYLKRSASADQQAKV